MGRLLATNVARLGLRLPNRLQSKVHAAKDRLTARAALLADLQGTVLLAKCSSNAILDSLDSLIHLLLMACDEDDDDVMIVFACVFPSSKGAKSEIQIPIGIPGYRPAYGPPLLDSYYMVVFGTPYGVQNWATGAAGLGWVRLIHHTPPEAVSSHGNVENMEDSFHSGTE